MREIKFRAWHPTLKKMFYDCRVSSNDWTDSSTHFSGEHDTLMQYTGLKDKNGKEIYEGDICKVIDPNGEDEIQYIVEWHPSSGYVYEPEEGYGEFDLTSVGFAMDMEYAFEVIGNIYENPELLEPTGG
jgi:uncharacterized phage protein (TIGR01671 family)